MRTEYNVSTGTLTVDPDFVAPSYKVQNQVTQITMRQARLALYNAGLLDDVENLIQTMPVPVQIEWEYATTVERNSPLVIEVARTLLLSDEQIDQLFNQASLL